MKSTAAQTEKLLRLAKGETLPASMLKDGQFEQMVSDGMLIAVTRGSRKSSSDHSSRLLVVLLHLFELGLLVDSVLDGFKLGTELVLLAGQLVDFLVGLVKQAHEFRLGERAVRGLHVALLAHIAHAEQDA